MLFIKLYHRKSNLLNLYCFDLMTYDYVITLKHLNELSKKSNTNNLKLFILKLIITLQRNKSRVDFS